MYNGIPGEPDQPSSTNENAICDFLDHPYSSPSEDSENDDVIRELDFSEFSMDNTTSLGLERNILSRFSTMGSVGIYVIETFLFS